MTSIHDQEDKTIIGTPISKEDTFHSSDGYKDYWDVSSPDRKPDFADVREPSPRPKLCVFCSAPWTPRMERIYLTMGFCETCYDSRPTNVLVCDNCNRIVYAK